MSIVMRGCRQERAGQWFETARPIRLLSFAGYAVEGDCQTHWTFQMTQPFGAGIIFLNFSTFCI